MSTKRYRTLHADFFTVETERCDFASILGTVNGMSGKARNFVTNGGDPIRLKKMSIRSEGRRRFFAGDMVKIRMTNLPTRIDQRGSEREIDFHDDEGIGEETAFFFDEERNVLVLQRNRNGVSFSGFEDYFAHFAGKTGRFQLLPMISNTALEQLRRSPRIGKFELEVAPTVSRMDIQASRSLSDVLSLMEQVAGEKVSVTIGVAPRRRRGLSMSSVVKTAQELLRIRERYPNDVRKLRAYAEKEDRKMAMLDLLVDRIRADDQVPYDESRRISFEARIDFLKKQWQSLDSKMPSRKPNDGVRS